MQLVFYACFFVERFWSLRHSVIYPTVVLRVDATVITSLYFQTCDRIDLIFFCHSKKIWSMTKKTSFMLVYTFKLVAFKQL